MIRRHFYILLTVAFLAGVRAGACAAEDGDQDRKANPAIQPSPAGAKAARHHHHMIELTSRNWHPLTAGERFELFRHDMIAWETHLSLAVGAGIAYASDSRDYLGDGWQGFGKRYGINFLDEANGVFFQTFLLPSLFHEESRYIPNDTGTKKGRVVYALKSVLVTRNDSGRFTLYKSKLLGELVSSGISTAYDYPHNRHRRIEDTFTRAGLSLGSEAAFNLFKEFWPDFARKIKLNIWLRSIIRSSIRDAVRMD